MGEVVGLDGAEKTNLDVKKIEDGLEKIAEHQIDIDKINNQARKDCAPSRDAISVLKTKLRDKCGITSKALNLLIADQNHKRHHAERKANLPDDAAKQYDMFGGE